MCLVYNTISIFSMFKDDRVTYPILILYYKSYQDNKEDSKRKWGNSRNVYFLILLVNKTNKRQIKIPITPRDCQNFGSIIDEDI